MCPQSLHHEPHSAVVPNFPCPGYYYSCCNSCSSWFWCPFHIPAPPELWLSLHHSYMLGQFQNSFFSLFSLPRPPAFLCWIMVMSSILSQAVFLIHLFVFMNIGMKTSNSWRMLTCQLSWACLPFRNASHGIPLTSFLNKLKFVHLKGLYSATVLIHSPQDPELHSHYH